jgi:carbon starvation protein
MLPFVFIIIACGAVSGFHGLVSSGTTAKQLDKEVHARPIGYGAMIGESLLGLLAVLACTAGFASPAAWHSHYASYGEVANNLGAKLGGFIEGVTSFLTSLGFPPELAAALIAMVVVSFALTTLDSATRLLRFNIEELGSSFGFKWTRNRYLSALVAVVVIALFAFYEVDGEPAALALWALFGTTNQLLAGLTLVLVTLYLKHRGKPTWYTGIPAVFVLLITLSSMVMNLSTYSSGPKADGLLFTVGCVLFLIALGVLFEALMALRRPKKASGLEIVFED